MAWRCAAAVVSLLLPLFPVALEAAGAAEKLKEGDKAIAGGFNTAAVRHYTDAIAIDPASPLIYTKRAQAYVGLHKPLEALKDLTEALALDPKSTQGLLHRGKLHRSMGNFDRAREDLEQVLAIKAGHKTASQELGAVFKAKDAYEGAKRQMAINDLHGAQLKLAAASSLLPDFPGVLMLQSTLFSKAGEHSKAVAELGKLLKIDPGNLEALLMRGRSYIALGDEETGTRHFREVLRFDPEHTEAKAAHKKIKSVTKLRQKAQDAMAARDNRGAEAAFVEAIAVDPTLHEINHAMHRELCRLRLQIGKSSDAIQSCDAALQRDGNLVDCALNRVRALLKLERWEEAANAARMLAQKHRGNGQVHQVLNEAERALKISKRKDYYKVLQVDRHADAATIKRQYRNLARKYHPDKATGDEAEKKEAEDKFREVAEAYEVLTDPEKRSRFDRGEDPNEQPQQGGGGWPGGGFHHHHHW